MRLTRCSAAMRRLLAAAVLAFAALAFVGCASQGREANALDREQYAWSGAIRWGNVDVAVAMLDPKTRAEQPPTAIELERYKQVQISAYRELGASRDLAAGTAVRDIEIGVVNRHTLAERTVRYREAWRWDAEARTWYITSGLPNLGP
ncbi:MAG: hypothetical protein NDI66_00890 [Pseudomonas sp.]|nr:hypothetical protein [Pseudomonas sp.]